MGYLHFQKYILFDNLRSHPENILMLGWTLTFSATVSSHS